MHLSLEDERAVDRLTLQLLQDAYFDLAAIVQGTQPEAADAILLAIEQRFTDVLSGLCKHQSEGASTGAIAVAVGERLGEIIGQAHGLTREKQAA